jgi:hypothetical protein
MPTIKTAMEIRMPNLPGDFDSLLSRRLGLAVAVAIFFSRKLSAPGHPAAQEWTIYDTTVTGM